MSSQSRIICLLTDFGLRDGYVASMKGVILSIAPHVTIVDISHEIDSFCISSGAYVLYSVVSCFPPDTVFVAVVDPGVGTERRAIIIESAGKVFIGPDNGLFSWILADNRASKIFWIDPEGISARYVNSDISSTFHGRDIFAPVAAHIASGVRVEELAIPAEGAPPVIGEWINPVADERSITGQVVHIDKFGNIVTNITKDFYRKWQERYFQSRLPFITPVVEVKSVSMSIEKTYGCVPEGSLLALWGSSNHLEISVNKGRASDMLSVGYLDEIRIWVL